MKKNNANANKETTVNSYDAIKRRIELGAALPQDYYTLGQIVAHSVLNKCLDPQAAAARGEVSDSGQSPVLLDLKRGIVKDVHDLDLMYRNLHAATELDYDADGDLTSTVVDRDARDAAKAYVSDRLSDGMDLVHDAILAALEAQEAHKGDLPGYLDRPVTRIKPTRTIRSFDDYRSKDVAYKTEDVAPIQDIYRAVRKSVSDRGSVKADPADPYTYIDAIDPETADRVYYRLGAYAAINGHAAAYSADYQTAIDIDDLIDDLGLTPREIRIVRRRLANEYNSYSDIATDLDISVANVRSALDSVGRKWIKAGYKDPCTGPKQSNRGVIQIDAEGNKVGMFTSVKAAASATGVNRGGISDCIHGRRKTAGGYVWQAID